MRCAPPNTHVCPVCMALPGVLPVINRERGREDDPGGAGAELHDRRAGRLRAQELPLSRPAQGLPDQPVRAAVLPRRLARDRGRSGETERIGITRAHLEEDTGKLMTRRGRQLTAVVTCRPEPRRRAAAGDRHRAGPALARRGPRVPDEAPAQSCATSASAPRTWRRAPCAARPTSACGPTAPEAVRHEGRGQEPELLPVGQAGAGIRGGAPDRAF